MYNVSMQCHCKVVPGPVQITFLPLEAQDQNVKSSENTVDTCPFLCPHFVFPPFILPGTIGVSGILCVLMSVVTMLCFPLTIQESESDQRWSPGGLFKNPFPDLPWSVWLDKSWLKPENWS